MLCTSRHPSPALASYISATTPVTIGAADEVPLKSDMKSVGLSPSAPTRWVDRLFTWGSEPRNEIGRAIA